MRIRALLRRACARMLRTRAAAVAAAACGLIVLFLLFADAKRLIAKGGNSSTRKDIPALKSAEGKNVEIPGVEDSAIPLALLRRLYLPDLPDTYCRWDQDRPREYPEVRILPPHKQQRVLVSGGAGFVGSHLVDRLMLLGHYVIVVDNFFTGSRNSVQHWMGHRNFELIRHDVIEPLYIEVDRIYHLASPASPPHYQYNPIKTIKTNTIGTINLLGLASRVRARFLMASTSEVYGDPEKHPQNEEYWGNVNPIGPRACYDESKRVAETLCVSYMHQGGVDVRIIRIFNTFGPRMAPDDGRVVSNFIQQALLGNALTVYGGGLQTRSFQFVHDLVSGMIALMESNVTVPVNVGNPEEHTIMDFATMIRDMIDPNLQIINLGAVTDDPQRRRPDITRARTLLGWSPQFPMADGLVETVHYFNGRLEHYGTGPSGLLADDV